MVPKKNHPWRRFSLRRNYEDGRFKGDAYGIIRSEAVRGALKDPAIPNLLRSKQVMDNERLVTL